MLTFDDSTITILLAATTKTDWANKLVTVLTTDGPLFLKCYHDPNGGDAVSSGTLFFSGLVSGTPIVSGGAITNFGTVSNGTMTAADLRQGTASLVLASTTHWARGSLGIVGTPNDYILSENPTAMSGLGFATSSSTNGPLLLPSGTGPVAPSLTSSAPQTIILQDWSDPENIIDVGYSSFDTIVENLEFEDVEIAGEIGDVAVRQCSETMIYNDFKFGATLLAMTSTNNMTDNTKPIYQVIIAARPDKIWPTYPFEDTRADAMSLTIPDAFKITIRDGIGNLMHTFEMRDGVAINDPTLQGQSQGWLGTPSNPNELIYGGPCRPRWNCGMLLVWQSGQTKVSSHAANYLPGFTPDSMRKTQCGAGFSFLGQEPGCTGMWNANGLAHWYMMPRWAMVWDGTGSLNPIISNDFYPNVDPTTSWMDGGHAHYNESRAEGWDYEPGSYSGHNWYTGPGGPRTDRVPVPLPLSIFMTDPNYFRPRGSIPIRPMVDAWGMAYFNHANHYFLDPQTLATLPDADVCAGRYSYMGAYYGPGPFNGGTDTNVYLLGPPNGAGFPAPDKFGREWYTGWALDGLHNYCRPGLWTMFFNSPAHAISEKTRYAASIMCQLSETPADHAPNCFLTRQGAWRLLALVVSWKTASRHPIGLSRAWVEKRLQVELESIYDTLYYPAMVLNAMDPMSQCLRNFGLGWGFGSPVNLNHDSKCYYYGITLVLMRQIGLFARARAISEKCAAVMDWTIACLDTYCIGIILDTFGTEFGGVVVAPDVPTGTPPVCYDSWAAWTEAKYPNGTPLASANDPYRCGWIRNPDNSIDFSQANNINTMHLRAQWAFLRRDFFPEYPNSRLSDAINKFQQYYDDYLVGVNAGTGQDWIYRMPTFGILNPPATLGPL